MANLLPGFLTWGVSFLNLMFAERLTHKDLLNCLGKEHVCSITINPLPDSIHSNHSASPSDGEYCFVILPASDRFQEYYRDIYAPAIRAAGLEPKRAGDLNRPGMLLKELWTFIEEAEVILADLTPVPVSKGKKELDAGVFYELGWAHALSKPVILVSGESETIPADLQTMNVIEYDQSRTKWDTKLQEELKTVIKATLENPKDSILPIVGIKKKASEAKVIEKKAKELTLKSKIFQEMEAEEEQQDQSGLAVLKQQLDELKKEIRDSKASENTSQNPVTWPADLLKKVRQMLKNGASKLDIYRELRDQGYTNTEAFEIFEAAQID